MFSLLIERFPKASTGFSPFELLYGFPVQGPLDLLKKSWESIPPAPQGVLSYVLQMRDRLEQYRAEAKLNLGKAQLKQKTWYDQKARHRVLQQGQKVMLLLPTSSNKLLAQWQGPYSIARQVGPVTHEISFPDKGEASQVYHINLLKEWKERKGSVEGMDRFYSDTDTKCIGLHFVLCSTNIVGQSCSGIRFNRLIFMSMKCF